MKAPRFRIAWIMVAVAVAAINFAAVRELLDPRAVESCDVFANRRPADGKRVDRRPPRSLCSAPGSRPFVLGFEVFGVLSLSVFAFLSFIFGLSGPIIWYLEFVFNSLNAVFGVYPAPSTELFACSLMLVGPQLIFALIGGFLSLRFKVTITRR